MSALDSALAHAGYDRGQTAVRNEKRPGPEFESVPSSGAFLAAYNRVMRRVEATPTGCLIWQGAVNSSGSAVVSVGRKVSVVSRVVWFAKYGEMPESNLERSCGNTRCVNAEHLRPIIPFSDEEKFWTAVDTQGPMHPHDPSLGRCWDWTGARYPTGYGNVTASSAGNYAHRLSFMLANKRSIAPGMFILHSCDRRSCVNPAHLREGTNQENVDDREERFYGRKKAS